MPFIYVFIYCIKYQISINNKIMMEIISNEKYTIYADFPHQKLQYFLQ